MSRHERAGLFDRLKKGLRDSAAYSRGELSLRTTALPTPPPPASAARVAALRRRLRMSQSVFAALLNVSPKLVQGWEQGIRKPARGDLRLLQLIESNPELANELIRPTVRKSGRVAAPSVRKAVQTAPRRRPSAA
jgi:putative transcriptional regulator